MATTNQYQKDLLKQVPRLRAFAHMLTRNHADADDLVQDTLLRAMRSQYQFEDGTNLRAWLMTIMRNSYFSTRRKLGRETSSDENPQFIDHLPVLPSQDDSVELAELRRALDALPAEQREALLLVTVMDHSLAEAAEIAGCAEGTIKSRVSRARDKLATLLHVERPPAASPRPNAHLRARHSGAGVPREL